MDSLSDSHSKLIRVGPPDVRIRKGGVRGPWFAESIRADALLPWPLHDRNVPNVVQWHGVRVLLMWLTGQNGASEVFVEK